MKRILNRDLRKDLRIKVYIRFNKYYWSARPFRWKRMRRVAFTIYHPYHISSACEWPSDVSNYYAIIPSEKKRQSFSTPTQHYYAAAYYITISVWYMGWESSPPSDRVQGCTCSGEFTDALVARCPWKIIWWALDAADRGHNLWYLFIFCYITMLI